MIPAQAVEAVMYPLVDSPTYTEEFADFAAIRTAFEALSEGLNFPLSWFLFDEQSDDWGRGGDVREFSLCVMMPRKSQTTVFTTQTFERSEVVAWLAGYVKDRVARWYGWTP